MENRLPGRRVELRCRACNTVFESGGSGWPEVCGHCGSDDIGIVLTPQEARDRLDRERRVRRQDSPYGPWEAR